MDSASLLKYNNIFKNYVEQQFSNPNDDLVKLFLLPVYKGAKTQTVIEKFRPILKKALNEFLSESLNEKLKLALNNTTVSQKENEVITTTNEWDALTLIKSLLKDSVDLNKISSKYTDSYFAILYENNVRKWICRLVLTNTQKTLILPDENKKEQRFQLKNIEQISDFSDLLIQTAKRYSVVTNQAAKKEILHTKWGSYDMPKPYRINLTRGPRNDLKKVVLY